MCAVLQENFAAAHNAAKLKAVELFKNFLFNMDQIYNAKISDLNSEITDTYKGFEQRYRNVLQAVCSEERRQLVAWYTDALAAGTGPLPVASASIISLHSALSAEAAERFEERMAPYRETAAYGAQRAELLLGVEGALGTRQNENRKQTELVLTEALERVARCYETASHRLAWQGAGVEGDNSEMAPPDDAAVAEAHNSAVETCFSAFRESASFAQNEPSYRVFEANALEAVAAGHRRLLEVSRHAVEEYCARISRREVADMKRTLNGILLPVEDDFMRHAINNATTEAHKRYDAVLEHYSADDIRECRAAFNDALRAQATYYEDANLRQVKETSQKAVKQAKARCEREAVNLYFTSSLEARVREIFDEELARERLSAALRQRVISFIVATDPDVRELIGRGYSFTGAIATAVSTALAVVAAVACVCGGGKRRGARSY
eukprot:TRINITY_DN5752_c0_g1_i2.p1 TRINITY_DN5752_c0_g1~~TRINITY_DN5752_c0_g1_i2.p1  ORF type:complete len:438 (-),score=121.82 TRINITY_DN5752_c0_g1_i2:106-1419(-)